MAKLQSQTGVEGFGVDWLESEANDRLSSSSYETRISRLDFRIS
jgi:hypothetical protein